MLFAQVLLSGLLMGCVFALIALGLTLIFGVMDIVNFAHGDFLMIGMYTALLTAGFFSIAPVLTIPFTAIVGFLLGIVSYQLLIRRIMRGPMLAQLFGTFGLSLFIRYLVMFIMGPEYHSFQEGLIVGKSFSLSGINFNVPKITAAGISIVLFILVYWLMNRTKLGKALRATSLDTEAAQFMGINTDYMNALAWGIGGATVGVAGGLLSTFYYVYPTIGLLFGVLAFATVALGGFGSVRGAFFAGLIVGVIQMFMGTYGSSELKFTAVYLVYFLVVVYRPTGLLGWGE